MEKCCPQTQCFLSAFKAIIIIKIIIIAMHARHNAPASDGELLPKFSGQMAFPWLTASLAGAAADLRAWRGRTCPGRSCPSLAGDAAGSGCSPQEGDAGSRCSLPQAHVPSCSASATLLQSDAGKSCLYFFFFFVVPSLYFAWCMLQSHSCAFSPRALPRCCPVPGHTRCAAASSGGAVRPEPLGLFHPLPFHKKKALLFAQTKLPACLLRVRSAGSFPKRYASLREASPTHSTAFSFKTTSSSAFGQEKLPGQG